MLEAGGSKRRSRRPADPRGQVRGSGGKEEQEGKQGVAQHVGQVHWIRICEDGLERTRVDGDEAWTRLHASCSSRALERMFKVQRQRMCPKVAEDVSHCKIANLQREEMWKTLTTELGRHTDSRSAANVCADDLLQGGSTKKKNINRPSRAKVISYSTNTIGQALGASSDTPRPMDSSDVDRSGDKGCEVRRRCRRSAEE